MTPECEAAWAAAIALARERNHREVREDHVLLTLLFDEDVRMHLEPHGDVEHLVELLEERLAPVESSRASGAIVPPIRASLEQALRTAARGPLGIRGLLGLRVSTAMLVDALLARADAQLTNAVRDLAPAQRPGPQPDELNVFLDPDPSMAEDRLIEWTLLFGVSRARATYIVHTALARGSALVGDFAPDDARRGHALAMEACAASGFPSPFTLVRGRGVVAVARSIEHLAMDVRATLGEAHRIATTRGDRVVSIPHVALALVDRDVIRQALVSTGVDVAALEASLANLVAQKAEPEIPLAGHAAILDDEVDVLLGTAAVYARGGRVRNQQLFAALFAHRGTRALFDAHHVKRGDVLLAFLHGVADDATIEDDERVDIVFHNDDYTTQEMVVAILEGPFEHPHKRAIALMLDVHERGQAVIGSALASDARARIARGIEMARSADMPLRITIRKRG